MAGSAGSGKAPDGTRFEWHGGAGPTIALIHGLGLNRQMWQWQIPALSERYRVLSFDLFGHGESPTPDTKPDLHLFSEQLYRLLAEHEIDRCAVIGFSLGGMIARRFAMDHADRVSALVILSSPYTRDDSAQQAIVKRVEQAREHGPSATVEAALERWFTEDFRAANSKVMDLVRQWVLANDRNVYPENYQVLADGVAEIVSPERPIQRPTLVMTGDEDFGNSPQMTHAIAAEIPGSQTVILPGLRHMALAEAPEICNPILLRFLDHAVTGATDVG